ncbi:MAG: sugar transferase [Thiohalocapsa sp.]
MRAVVFADRSAAALAPLDKQYAIASLPIAGKELLLYRLEELIGAGVLDIVFVLSDHADKLEELLGRGERWGAHFRVVLSRGSEAPSAVWRRIKHSDEPLLVLRGDVLCSPCIGRFLNDAQGQAGTVIHGRAADPRASLLLLRSGAGTAGPLLDRLHWDSTATTSKQSTDAPPQELAPDPAPDPVSDQAQAPMEADVSLADGDLNLIQDLSAFHRANLDLVAKRFRGLQPAGREVALGLIAGRHAKVSPRSLKQGQAYVGEQSRVSPEAELIGEVMIARDVVVDRAATIFDSVILPHSYVGELVEVGNAIVATDFLIRVDTGAVLKISDAFLLGRLGGDGVMREGARNRDRIAGALLLLLSLPLWPLALLAAALAMPRDGTRLLRTEMLIGNRLSDLPATSESERTFFTWRFNTRIPVLAMLPRILAVINGDLRLVGVMPLTPQQSESRTEEWQRVRDEAPVGLIGPTQLTLPADAPLDECLMSDAFYTGQSGVLKDLRFLWQGVLAFFSGRAWQRVESIDRDGPGNSNHV